MRLGETWVMQVRALPPLTQADVNEYNQRKGTDYTLREMEQRRAALIRPEKHLICVWESNGAYRSEEIPQKLWLALNSCYLLAVLCVGILRLRMWVCRLPAALQYDQWGGKKFW